MKRLRVLILTILLVFGLGLGTGCGGVRVALVHPTGVMRAGPDMRGRVYVLLDGEWILSKNKVHVPEGFYMTDLPNAED